MNQSEQLLYMKIRIILLASKKWKKEIGVVATDFLNLGVLDYIDSNFELFHIQGDESIFEDICNFISFKESEC